MSLFKKKVGGTFFGNLLRLGSNKVSGGLLGNGANMLTVEGAALADTKAQLALVKAANVEAAKPILLSTAAGVGGAVAGLTRAKESLIYSQSPAGVTANVQNGYIVEMIKTYWWALAAGVGAIIYLIKKK